ncbi:MAG: hypothetical protein MRY32_07520 [Rickettsiales bacterium]|nr:hypothetical protein [Rickettsiales bacterium]
MSGEDKIHTPQPQDLAAVIDSAQALEHKFGPFKNPIGLVLGYGLVDDHFTPLDDHTLDALLQDWDEHMQPVFDQFSVSEKEQAVLRSAASQYFHAFHLTAAMRDFRSEINDSLDTYPPSFEEVDEWQADMISELHQFITGTITKNTLEQLYEFHDTDLMALKSLGTSIGRTTSAYLRANPSCEKMEVHPEKTTRLPETLVKNIRELPDRAADQISLGVRMNS